MAYRARDSDILAAAERACDRVGYSLREKQAEVDSSCEVRRVRGQLAYRKRQKSVLHLLYDPLDVRRAKEYRSF